MKLLKAQKIIEQNKHLIGEKYRGAQIDEFIIYPNSESEWDEFRERYLRTLNSDFATEPFLQNANLEIGVVCDKKRISINSIFFHTNIDNLKDEGLKIL